MGDSRDFHAVLFSLYSTRSNACFRFKELTETFILSQRIRLTFGLRLQDAADAESQPDAADAESQPDAEESKKDPSATNVYVCHSYAPNRSIQQLLTHFVSHASRIRISLNPIKRILKRRITRRSVCACITYYG